MADNTSTHPRWLSVSQTATRLGVGAPTVRRWIHEGHIKAAQPAGDGGILLVAEAELTRLEAGDDLDAQEPAR